MDSNTKAGLVWPPGLPRRKWWRRPFCWFHKHRFTGVCDCGSKGLSGIRPGLYVCCDCLRVFDRSRTWTIVI